MVSAIWNDQHKVVRTGLQTIPRCWCCWNETVPVRVRVRGLSAPSHYARKALVPARSHLSLGVGSRAALGRIFADQESVDPGPRAAGGGPVAVEARDPGEIHHTRGRGLWRRNADFRWGNAADLENDTAQYEYGARLVSGGGSLDRGRLERGGAMELTAALPYSSTVTKT
mmetsp:Transcript_6658/g.16617  ORF Transcript_6658/g.16617 Transcript_6658/m.16617 type:complete len:170 (+) Transcript_6658:716-1225(+)